MSYKNKKEKDWTEEDIMNFVDDLTPLERDVIWCECFKTLLKRGWTHQQIADGLRQEFERHNQKRA